MSCIVWASFHPPGLPSLDGGGAGDSCHHCSCLIVVVVNVVVVVVLYRGVWLMSWRVNVTV